MRARLGASGGWLCQADARGAPLLHNAQLTGADSTWWRPDDAVFARLNAPERLAAQGPWTLATAAAR